MTEIEMKVKETLTLVVVGLLVVSGFGVAVGITVDDELQEDEPVEIEDWHDLDEVRDDLDGDYVLMNDLDEDTEGYDELVDTENGWEPIGDDDNEFNGTFDGNENEISDLYIDRSEENYI